MIYAEKDGTNVLFRMFSTAQKRKEDIITNDIQYIQEMWKVYEYFCHVEIKPEFIPHTEIDLDFYECQKLVHENKRHNIEFDWDEYVKPYEPKRKWITGSFLHWDKWIENNRWIEHPKNQSEFVQTRYAEVYMRSFKTPELEMVLELCKSHPDFIDIGDSRLGTGQGTGEKTAEELIQTYELLRDSKMYVGMVSSYERWTRLYKIPFITMMDYDNYRHKAAHKLWIWPEHYK